MCLNSRIARSAAWLQKESNIPLALVWRVHFYFLSLFTNGQGHRSYGQFNPWSVPSPRDYPFPELIPSASFPHSTLTLSDLCKILSPQHLQSPPVMVSVICTLSHLNIHPLGRRFLCVRAFTEASKPAPDWADLFTSCCCYVNVIETQKSLVWPHHHLTALLYLHICACKCQLFTDEDSRGCWNVWITVFSVLASVSADQVKWVYLASEAYSI